MDSFTYLRYSIEDSFLRTQFSVNILSRLHRLSTKHNLSVSINLSDIDSSRKMWQRVILLFKFKGHRHEWTVHCAQGEWWNRTSHRRWYRLCPHDTQESHAHTTRWRTIWSLSGKIFDLAKNFSKVSGKINPSATVFHDNFHIFAPRRFSFLQVTTYGIRDSIIWTCERGSRLIIE